ncbi:hypothetical protein [Indiicoccus explosivorum]|uniref:hypothetical protein n=1 Tax=Indiicoccus explosivorum TaxID=1917864 RepID=UPI000B44C2E7|nr:hypothetical protein [Indiicoccus explosivorum]
MIIYILFGIILLAVLFAAVLDWRRKRRRDTAQKSINSHAKEGEDSNYTGGGQGGYGGGL